MNKSIINRTPLKGFFTFLLLMGMSSWTMAQKVGELVVIVQDGNSQAISAATVTVSNAALDITRTSASDDKGKSLFGNLPADSNYCISVSFTGLSPKQECHYIVSVGKRSSAVFTLDEFSSTDMDEVVVTAIGIKQRSEERRVGKDGES